MKPHPAVTGRRERAKQDKRNRILAAASLLLAERDIGRVTMQEIADLLRGFSHARPSGEERATLRCRHVNPLSSIG